MVPAGTTGTTQEAPSAEAPMHPGIAAPAGGAQGSSEPNPMTRIRIQRRPRPRAGFVALALAATSLVGFAPLVDAGTRLAEGAPSEGARAENPWLERKVLNFAHQGGEIEAPSDTLFALKRAKAKGADVLEIDVHATADREIVVLHDATVDRTTNGSGRVDEMTLAEIKKLDAAHWFVPGCGTCNDKPEEAFTYRGYATGEQRLPRKLAKYEPNDFTIPTLREVLEIFPADLINIEIKASAPDTEPYEDVLASLLQEFERTDDTIVVSFLDHAIERFKLLAPEVNTATATAQAALFYLSTRGPLRGAPNERYQALQVPIYFEGVEVVTEEFVAEAHANGLAVHVWTIDDRETMVWLIDIGVDGIMSNRPTLLEKVLLAKGALFDPY